MTEQQDMLVTRTEPLPFGWAIWESPQLVEHLIDDRARCTTCGKHHDVHIEQQVEWLYSRQREREAAIRADTGSAALESGAWVDNCRDVAGEAPAWVGDGAKREYLRCNGLDEFRRVH